MARYREKDETDLIWNSARRYATAMIRVRFRDAEERVSNVVLGELWRRYAASLQKGETLELDRTVTDFIDHIISETVEPELRSLLDEPEAA